MLSRMDSAELTEWIAFYELEPFGYEIGMLGHAITASTVANFSMAREKGAKAYKVEEFMPKFDRKQTPDEMINLAAMYTIGLGGEDKRHGSE
jgi:hypothetical protein